MAANRTEKGVKNVHGADPQHMIESITRSRIYESNYWKEYCFGLTAETVIDRAVELSSIGGSYGATLKPCEFLCLVLKLLQIQPEMDIILEYLNNDDYKYLRVLAAFYLRLVGKHVEIYQHLEPLLSDYRKLRLRLPDGSFTLTYMDQVIDDLLHEDRIFGTILPRLLKRSVLEENGELGPYVSPLQGELNGDAESHSSSDENERKRARSSSPDVKDYRWREPPSPKPSAVTDPSSLSSFEKETLDIAATNALRAKLGLKPLK